MMASSTTPSSLLTSSLLPTGPGDKMASVPSKSLWTRREGQFEDSVPVEHVSVSVPFSSRARVRQSQAAVSHHEQNVCQASEGLRENNKTFPFYPLKHRSPFLSFASLHSSMSVGEERDKRGKEFRETSRRDIEQVRNPSLARCEIRWKALCCTPVLDLAPQPTRYRNCAPYRPIGRPSYVLK
ncbi:hypothetical protein EYF80_026698 [Liparis tanakae]|uniref:Uncharacterized protein n=1 Tax=Liparis tanakae TaxID=230148 RepID=A0A4Z2HE74_9TELE|nr:hypothetical protein EYF80_026698 [Liparis tanakae]